MNRKLSLAMTMMFGVLTMCSTVLAHHGTNMFDMSKPVTLKGTITRFEWGNPHNRIFLDVTDDKGNVVHWLVSTEPPAAVLEKGWTRKSLKPGDHVTAEVFVALDGGPTGNLHRIVLADGRVLEAYAVGANPGGGATPDK